MEQAGKRDTDEFRAMQAELGRLADAMADANTQAKIMSDDYQNMNTVLEVMGGISGAFFGRAGCSRTVCRGKRKPAKDYG